MKKKNRRAKTLTSQDVLKLSNHWVMEMRCDHEAKTDQVYCACGAICQKKPSVQEAAYAWAEHVVDAINGRPQNAGWLTYSEMQLGAIARSLVTMAGESVSTARDIRHEMYQARCVQLEGNDALALISRELEHSQSGVSSAIRELGYVLRPKPTLQDRIRHWWANRQYRKMVAAQTPAVLSEENHRKLAEQKGIPTDRWR